MGEADEGGRFTSPRTEARIRGACVWRNLVSAPVRSHLSTGHIYVCALTVERTRTIDCI